MADEHGGTGVEGTGDQGGLTALKEEASEVTAEVREEVKERADRWTSSLGEKGAGMARALEAASTCLREEGDTALAELADRAASRVERMAGYLEKENPSGLVDDLERLGRSNPAAFLGGAFIAGVLGGRLLRASGSNGAPGGDRGNGTDRTAWSEDGNGSGGKDQPSSRGGGGGTGSFMATGNHDHTPGSEARGGAHGDVHGEKVGSTGSGQQGRTL